MNYSVTIGGIIAALVLPVLAQWGFSETCSQEILGVGIPTLLTLPGLVTAYFGRLRQGDVTKLGFKK
jgi:hypothetical protein